MQGDNHNLLIVFWKPKYVNRNDASEYERSESQIVIKCVVVTLIHVSLPDMEKYYKYNYIK